MAATKSSTKSQPKPKRAKKNGAPKPKQSKPKQSAKPKSASAKPKPKPKQRDPRMVKIADAATALVTSQRAADKSATGKRAKIASRKSLDSGSIARAPISSVKVELVMSKLVKSQSASAVAKSIGFSSVAEAERYASGAIGRADLSPEINRALTEASRKIGDPKKHKINGRALAAVLVAAAK